ncbi:MAG: ATP-binding protein [Anaerolineaceae bacterium]|nr:ATP-binding protein [Anaerolineaceae bacterium]
MAGNTKHTDQHPTDTESSMDNDHHPEAQNNTPSQESPVPVVRSLKHLIEIATGKHPDQHPVEQESGLADHLPFPFLAIVGQQEMKLALLLNLINPLIGGVLLLGPRGTGKTTAVRSLINLMPKVPRSLCYFGCTEQDIEEEGIDSVCPDCAKKYGEGLPLTRLEDAKLVELPLNARLEDVIGGLDERAALHHRMRLRRGILSRADRNLLYIDEVNLLEDHIVNIILDAAALGTFTVRRGAISATYNARFTLIGSMNPEEGKLRPQIMDRFGLRVIVPGLNSADARWKVYQRVVEYHQNPKKLISSFWEDTLFARDEIQNARNLLSKVEIPEEIARIGLNLVHTLKIDSLRAEITLFEAARAYAAASERTEVIPDDLVIVSPMALRMRQSDYFNQYLEDQTQQDEILRDQLTNLIHPDPTAEE